MRRSRKPIIIASRRSRLARVQAEAVGAALGRLHPHARVEFRWIESEGDQLTSVALADAGGKGLFVRAIERALLQGEADVAVHSMKDLPAAAAELTPGLVVAAVPPRADVRDCLVTRTAARTIDELPQGACVGTSSPRRAAQLRRRRPDLRVQPMRGNIETRLAKVTDPGRGEPFDATLLAVAGLTRAGLAEHAQLPIDPDVLLPAAGQGALAVQCRMDDHVTLRRCLPLNDAPSSEAVHAERRIVAALRGDCHSPIAVLAEPTWDGRTPGLRLRARVLSPDGGRCIEADQSAPVDDLRYLVPQVIQTMLAGGADALLHG